MLLAPKLPPTASMVFLFGLSLKYCNASPCEMVMLAIVCLIGLPVTTIFSAGKNRSMPVVGNKYFCSFFAKKNIAFARKRIAFVYKSWDAFCFAQNAIPENLNNRLHQ